MCIRDRDMDTLQKGKGKRPKTSTTAVRGQNTGAKTPQEDGQNASAMTSVESNRAGTASSPVLENVQVTRFQPSAEDLALAGPSGLWKDKEKKTPELTVSPKDILLVPVPKRKVTNKGPKTLQGSFDYILSVQRRCVSC